MGTPSLTYDLRACGIEVPKDLPPLVKVFLETLEHPFEEFVHSDGTGSDLMDPLMQDIAIEWAKTRRHWPVQSCQGHDDAPVLAVATQYPEDLSYEGQTYEHLWTIKDHTNTSPQEWPEGWYEIWLIARDPDDYQTLSSKLRLLATLADWAERLQ